MRQATVRCDDLVDRNIRVLAFMEASKLTGPAKNLIRFALGARIPGRDLRPAVTVSVATFRRRAPGHGPDSEFVREAEAADIQVDQIDERHKFDPRVLVEMNRLVRKAEPAVIQTHSVKSHFLVRVSGLWREYPWIAFHHGHTSTDFKMRCYNQLDRWSLGAADRVVTMSRPFARQLVRAGVDPQRVQVIHNSVDPPCHLNTTGEIAAIRMRLGISPLDRVILTIGRLSSEKGHRDLLRSFHMVSGSNPNMSVKLVLVGEGPEQRRLESETARLGLEGRVIFAGHSPDVGVFHALADVLAIPSHSEGSPNVLLEAMASGLPVVATSVGGIPEIAIHDESALLVPRRNIRMMSAALQLLLRDARVATRISERARQAALTRFAPETRVRELCDLYSEVSGIRAYSSVDGLPNCEAGRLP